MKFIFSNFGRLDVLVNCIGNNIKPKDGIITEEIWDSVMEVNVKSIFFICEQFMDFFTIEKPACIINFSSTAGIRPLPMSPHYITAKAGLIALSKYYAKIMAPFVRINVIAPGFIKTSSHNSETYDTIKNIIPLKRMAEISEIVETVYYIIKCQYITGEVIIIDGGLIL